MNCVHLLWHRTMHNSPCVMNVCAGKDDVRGTCRQNKASETTLYIYGQSTTCSHPRTAALPGFLALLHVASPS